MNINFPKPDFLTAKIDFLTAFTIISFLAITLWFTNFFPSPFVTATVIGILLVTAGAVIVYLIKNIQRILNDKTINDKARRIILEIVGCVVSVVIITTFFTFLSWFVIGLVLWAGGGKEVPLSGNPFSPMAP